MKAIIQKKYGGPEVLKIMDVPKPVPNKNDVLVEVYTTNVSSGDTIVRSLNVPFPIKIIMRLMFGILGPRKKIPGYTAAGIVVEIGESVKEFKVGDKVYGINGTRSGCYSEYVCIKESGAIVHLPENLTFDEAAPIPFGAMSALHIMNKVTINKNDNVLIYGASGSVGTYAVQLAKYYGANVTAVCSTKNHDIVKSIGADKVIDYRKEDYTKLNKEYDIVFDAVGKTTKKQGSKILKDSGKYISIKSITTEKKEKLLTLNKIMSEFPITTIIDRTYSLDEIVEAHRYVDEGHKVGNVIIKVKS